MSKNLLIINENERLCEDLVIAYARIKELEEALWQVYFSSCDAGDSKGKTGCEWISAACREISEKALATKDK